MDSTHPADYWENYDRAGEYQRSADIVRSVYDNIDKLWGPKYDSVTSVVNAVTLWDDPALVKTRLLLGFYKPTTLDSQAKADALNDFNNLLQSNGLASQSYSATELSDAEHYTAAATIAMVPQVGPYLSVGGSAAWDTAQGILGTLTGDLNSLPYNLKQLANPDMAGASYGADRLFSEGKFWPVRMP